MDYYGFVKIKFVSGIPDPRGWKYRWLTISNGAISIYRRETEEKLLGKIFLTRASTILPVLDVLDNERYCFTVSDSRGSKVLIALSDPSSLEVWMMGAINSSHGDYRPSENFYFGDQTNSEVNTSSFDSRMSLSKHQSFLELKGYYEKQGHIVKSWKKRYIVLNIGSICYYDDAAVASPESISSSPSTLSPVKALLDIARSVTNGIRRLSSQLILNELKIKGAIHIDRYTKVSVLPPKVAGREFVLAIISNRHRVGKVESGNHDTSQTALEDSEDIEDADIEDFESDDEEEEFSTESSSTKQNAFQSIVSPKPEINEKKISLRISFPDQATLTLWMNTIKDIVTQHQDLLDYGPLRQQLEKEQQFYEGDNSIKANILSTLAEDYFDDDESDYEEALNNS